MTDQTHFFVKILIVILRLIWGLVKQINTASQRY